MDLGAILLWVVIGGLAGLLASALTKQSADVSDKVPNILETIVLGIVGALLGGFLLPLVGVNLEDQGFFGSLLSATIGAVVLLLVVGLVRSRRTTA